jgi:hypothetical protein
MNINILALVAVKSDLEAGTPDEELMEKYELTPSELQTLFDGLIRAIAIGASDVCIKAE